MPNARAIYRLLIDDEQPAPLPDDPNQSGFDVDASLDPTTEITRYTEQPFRVRSGIPTDLYQKIEKLLRGRPQKKVKNNTYAIRHSDRLAIRLHQTDVITAYPDGRVVADTGGWETLTTRDRMSDWLCSGWNVYTLKGQMGWFNYATGERPWDSDRILPFTDGDTILADGTLEMQADPVFKKRRKKKADNVE